MIVAKPNINNDLTLNKFGEIDTAIGGEAVAILTKQRVQTVKGECIFEPDKGIDYFGVVFSATPNYNYMRMILKDEIEGTLGVKKITKLGVKSENGTMSYYAEAIGDDGVTIAL